MKQKGPDEAAPLPIAALLEAQRRSLRGGRAAKIPKRQRTHTSPLVRCRSAVYPEVAGNPGSRRGAGCASRRETRGGPFHQPEGQPDDVIETNFSCRDPPLFHSVGRGAAWSPLLRAVRSPVESSWGSAPLIEESLAKGCCGRATVRVGDGRAMTSRGDVLVGETAQRRMKKAEGPEKSNTAGHSAVLFYVACQPGRRAPRGPCTEYFRSCSGQ